MSNERVLGPGVWASGVPTTGPIGANETLGFWFEVDEAGWLTGFRQYSDGRHPNFALFQLWAESGDVIAQALRPAPEVDRDPGGAGWRNTWLHPRCPLGAATPYLLSASVSEFWVNFGALVAAPITSGHITVYQDGSSPDPRNGIYDAVTDASQYYGFLTPPGDGTVGHLYGVDLLIEFPL